MIAVDPTRRRGGGALLGDRIRMNALDGDRVFFRSLATRGAHELPDGLADVIDGAQGGRLRPRRSSRRRASARATPAIVPFVDTLDVRDDAGVRRRLASSRRSTCSTSPTSSRSTSSSAAAPRTRCATSAASWSATARRSASSPQDMPVFGTSRRHASTTTASPRSTSTCAALLAEHGPPGRARARCAHVDVRHSTGIAPGRARPTGCATSPRSPRPCAATTPRTEELAEAARRVQRLEAVPSRAGRGRRAAGVRRAARAAPARRSRTRSPTRSPAWPAVVEAYSGDEQVVRVRDREIRTALTRESLSGNRIRRVALPRYADHGELLRFWRRENLPGRFPFTAGVFPFKREGEDPARMFAGEGDPFRTNRRFQLLSADGRRPPGCRPRSTRSRSTAATPTSAPTSTARSAPPACRSPRSTT